MGWPGTRRHIRRWEENAVCCALGPTFKHSILEEQVCVLGNWLCLVMSWEPRPTLTKTQGKKCCQRSSTRQQEALPEPWLLELSEADRVSVLSGCHNRIPQMEGPQQQADGGCKSEIKELADSVLGEDSILSLQAATFSLWSFFFFI